MALATNMLIAVYRVGEPERVPLSPSFVVLVREV